MEIKSDRDLEEERLGTDMKGRQRKGRRAVY